MRVSWQKLVIMFVVIATAIFLLLRSCGGDVFSCNKGRDTVSVRVDTLYLPAKIDTHYVPQPYKVVVYKPVLKFRTDTIEYHDGIDVFYLDADSVGAEQYYSVKYYSDTVKIDYGTAVIEDTVTQNQIAGRGVRTTMKIPMLTKTVTLFQPKRNIVYLGFSGTGSKQNFFYSIGTDISLKTKNDRMYTAGVNLTRDNQLLYQGGVKFPIRLKK